MKILKLKNGSEEVEPLVTTTMMALETLIVEEPLAFYDLVAKSRDKNRTFFGNGEKILEERALISNGIIHNSIRNVVLSAVVGEGLSMTLGNPLMEIPDS